MLTNRQQAILRGVLRDREDYANRTPRYQHGNREFARERLRIDDAKDGLVRTDPAAWLGATMTASLRMGVSRDYAAMERAGLLDRVALGHDGATTTHLQLTEAGEQAARELADSLPNSAQSVALQSALQEQHGAERT